MAFTPSSFGVDKFSAVKFAPGFSGKEILAMLPNLSGIRAIKWRTFMKRSQIQAASAAMVLSVAVGAFVWAAEKDDAALAKAPAKVQATARKALGEKKLEEFGKESIGGMIVYEIGFKVGGVDHAYIISEAGELIQEEADVEIAKLPAPVAAAVKKAQPKGTISEAATATAGSKHFYEIEVKVDKELHAIKVSENGKVLADDIVKSLPVEGAAK